MNRRPEFVIIAGPNGASKSRLGPFYSSTTAFDGDKLAMDLRHCHPEWKDSWISGTVITTLMREKEKAILQNKSFAFETNFTSDLVYSLIDDFKKADYKICLIYFGLDSIADSTARVMQRVAMGGHNVADDVIAYNFEESIIRIRKSLHLFENITFIDGSTDFGDIVAIHIEKSGLHNITDHPCLWFNRYFLDAFEKR